MLFFSLYLNHYHSAPYFPAQCCFSDLFIVLLSFRLTALCSVLWLYHKHERCLPCLAWARLLFGIYLPVRRIFWGFLGSSAGKESACNAGDPRVIPGSGRSPGEGWATHSSNSGLPCCLSQTAENLPAMQTWVRYLGWEAPLEDGVATHCIVLAWRIPLDGRAWWATVHGVTKSRAWLRTKYSTARRIS